MDKISALITVKYVVLYSTVAKIMFNDFNCTTQRKIGCTSEVNIKNPTTTGTIKDLDLCTLITF